MDNYYLDKIWIYPIKALDGIELNKSTINNSGGLIWDRQWALKTDSGQLLNGKNNACMHLIQSNYDLDEMTVYLKYREKSWNRFSLKNERKEIEKWFSSIIAEKIHFVHTDTHYSDDQKAPGPTLISRSTLEKIGEWFGIKDLDELRRRFRTNLEIAGCPPFWEESLLTHPARKFTIGNILFNAEKVCKRCVVPSRDPATGEAYKDFIRKFIGFRKAGQEIDPDNIFLHNYYRLAINTSIANPQDINTLKTGDKIQPLTVKPV